MRTLRLEEKKNNGFSAFFAGDLFQIRNLLGYVIAQVAGLGRTLDLHIIADIEWPLGWTAFRQSSRQDELFAEIHKLSRVAYEKRTAVFFRFDF